MPILDNGSYALPWPYTLNKDSVPKEVEVTQYDAEKGEWVRVRRLISAHPDDVEEPVDLDTVEPMRLIKRLGSWVFNP